MKSYLLSTYRLDGEVSGAPDSPEDMQLFMDRVMRLEEEMESAGVFLFGGALAGAESAGVAKPGETLITDGPFAEAKEQIAGFYIIGAEDVEAAKAWARRVAEATNHPIELRPFHATGLLKDQNPAEST